MAPGRLTAALKPQGKPRPAHAAQPKSLALKQINFQRKHEMIYAELRLAIMAGQFAPGQRLKLRDLARELGTSAMPVRDALGKLIAEQALVQTDSGGASVPLATRALVREVMEARALLEGDAAARAAQLMPRENVARVRLVAEQLTQASRSRDILRYLKLNQSLKFGIYAHCGSTVLLGLIESLWLRVGPFLRYLSRDLEGMVAINFHDDALDAIQSRNPEKARSAIARDITAGMNFLMAHAVFDGEDIG